MPADAGRIRLFPPDNRDLHQRETPISIVQVIDVTAGHILSLLDIAILISP
ncbi:hypothetical protein ABLB90_21655 [Photorhabdus bodei]|uniref:hypothetical protein n=1 Tax=Photorhabdus TaxID=29487 RepID=UPI001E543028|nr:MULTISPECIES: hypothetical protein [Photorhabdus]